MSIFTDVLDKIYPHETTPPPIVLPPPTQPIVIPEPPSIVTPNGAMSTSKQGLAEITGYEGICTAPYRDSVGVWTFGIGHTRYDGAPIPESMPRGVDHPLEEIFALFQNRIKRYEDDVNKALHVQVTQAQFDALVSFHYNTGAIAHATLTQAINNNARKEAITSYFMQWTHGGGRVIGGLVTRRTNEAKLYRSGIYTNDGMALVTTADVTGREMTSHAHEVNVLEYIK